MIMRAQGRALAFDGQNEAGFSAMTDALPVQAPDLPKVAPIDPLAATAPFDPLAADTVPGSSASTATLALGGSVDVTIDTLGDHDWYRVDLLAGVTYTIQTWSMSDGGSPDSFLSVRNLAGTELASDDDSGDGNYSLVSFTPTSNGTYFIDAGSFQNEQTGSYHLSIAQVMTGGDQIGGTIATAGSITVGGSRDSNIDFGGDHDFYAINLTAGQTYIFRTGGIAPTTATDTILTLRDASGAQLLTNDDAGEGSFSGIRYTATTTGTYYLDVSAFGNTTGGFNLTAFTADTPTVWTNDQIANQLTNGYWGGSSHHFNVAPGGTLTFNVQGLTADGQTLARAALAIWTDVTGINFSEVTSGGQIVYDDEQDGAFANATWSNGITSVANVNVSRQWLTNYGTSLNSYSFQTYLHETGHALGLGHAGNYNGSADYNTDSLYLNDSWATTVMSYFDQSENTYFAGQGFTKQFALTPMVADAIAVANLYGASTLTRTGDTTYGFNDTSGVPIYNASVYGAQTYTIYDSGGIDTLDYSGFSQNQLINLNPETFSNIGTRTGNVSIARGTVIENAIGGSGNDTIVGNSADNFINLRFGGSDTVTGADGNDTFYTGNAFDSGDRIDGGNGTDTLIIQNNFNGTISATMMTGIEVLRLLPGNDTTYVNMGGTPFSYTITTVDANIAAGATLTVQAGTLRANEVVTFNGAAESDGHFNITSGAANDTLTGGALSDTLAGGGGMDIFHGGGGDDVINVTGSDYVAGEIYDGGAGNDTLSFFSTGSIDISGATISSIETLFYNSQPLTSTLSLTLAQLAGFNTLSVATSLTLTTGGAISFAGKTVSGTFNLTGDTIFDLTGATALNGLTITVNGNSGNDTITGTATVDILSGGGGDDVIDSGLGNDTLYGGDGNDRLFSNGGEDTMYGGAGDDVFIFDSAGDRAFENPGEGFDVIKSFVSYSLVGVSNIEQLRVMGTADLNATGNANANNLAGNDGNNILDGGGGGDHMKGLAGNDIYIVRNVNDSIVEFAGNGDDTVKSTISYVLANASNVVVEHLWTIDKTATTAINLTGNDYSHDIQGNAGANVLTGGSGNDTIQGFGGNDTLFGGAGNDIFVFQAGTGQDSVGDFVSGTDKLDLSAFGFANFAAVQAATHDVGGSAVIDLGGGNSVTLTGVLKAQIQSGDVITSGGMFGAAVEPTKAHVEGGAATELAAGWQADPWAGQVHGTPFAALGLMPAL